PREPSVALQSAFHFRPLMNDVIRVDKQMPGKFHRIKKAEIRNRPQSKPAPMTTTSANERARQTSTFQRAPTVCRKHTIASPRKLSSPPHKFPQKSRYSREEKPLFHP